MCEPNPLQTLLGLEFLLASGAWKTKLYSSRPFRSLVAAAASYCLLHTLRFCWLALNLLCVLVC